MDRGSIPHTYILILFCCGDRTLFCSRLQRSCIGNDDKAFEAVKKSSIQAVRKYNAFLKSVGRLSFNLVGVGNHSYQIHADARIMLFSSTLKIHLSGDYF